MEFSKHLSRVLHRQKVLSMEDLRKELGGRSRVSVFRDLKTLDYRSSYSHAGKYYALCDVAKFDKDGLWHYEDKRFSAYGTLKETVFHLVENSEAGYQHEELRQLLQIRVHNTLLDLMREKRLRRLGQEKQYLYVSGSSQRARTQHEKREELSRSARVLVSVEMIIEILAEVIRGACFCVNVAELTHRLSQRNLQVTQRQVAHVLNLYAVKKTLDSP